MLRFARCILGVLCFATAGVAVAVPTGTLTFRDPTGTVGATDSIDVWVTLTLASDSEALQTDSTGAVTSGIDPSDIPAGFTVSRSNVNNFFSCSGTFTTGCSAPPYNFNFNLGANSFAFAQNLDLQPGDSQDFLFGTFTPNPSPASAGTYIFFNTGFEIQMFDDTQDNPSTGSPPLEQDLLIAQTCSPSDPACAFTRTVLGSVTPAPEPATLTLLGLALAGMGFARRRKLN